MLNRWAGRMAPPGFNRPELGKRAHRVLLSRKLENNRQAELRHYSGTNNLDAPHTPLANDGRVCDRN